MTKRIPFGLRGGDPPPDPEVRGNNPLRQRIDAPLLVAAANGDESALDGLTDFAFMQCELMLGESSPKVDDTTRSVVLSVIEQVRDGTFDPDHPSHPSAWVTSIACEEVRNGVLDTSGVKLRFDAAPAESLPLTSALEGILDTPRGSEVVRRAYHALVPEARMVLFLSCYEQLSVKETAKLLGVRESTVRMRLARAAAELREACEKALTSGNTAGRQ